MSDFEKDMKKFAAKTKLTRIGVAFFALVFIAVCIITNFVTMYFFAFFFMFTVSPVIKLAYL